MCQHTKSASVGCDPIMQGRRKRVIRFLACFVLHLLLSLGALAQQEVTFPQVPSERLPVWRGYGEQVTAILSLPPETTEKIPAIVLIHTRGGYDHGHYEFYGAPLRQEGFATLELILFRVNPTHLPSDLVPHAFGALKYLASHPRIDPNRIGILGFSLGGILAMYTASEVLATEHLGSTPRFAAHVPVYPTCWIHEGVARGRERQKRLANVYTKLTGAPIHILAGGKDQWDDPDTCQKFIEALTPDARRSILLTYYPDATHTWDKPSSSHFSPQACKGRGCQVRNIYDPEIAQKGRQVVIEFFTSALLRTQTK